VIDVFDLCCSVSSDFIQKPMLFASILLYFFLVLGAFIPKETMTKDRSSLRMMSLPLIASFSYFIPLFPRIPSRRYHSAPVRPGSDIAPKSGFFASLFECKAKLKRFLQCINSRIWCYCSGGFIYVVSSKLSAISLDSFPASLFPP
jgi:hypothetical protein